MKAICILIISSLFCLVCGQTEITTQENISEDGVKSISTTSMKLEKIGFTEDELNSMDITIYRTKWEESWNFSFGCDLWLNLNSSSLSETALAIVLEDERTVYMLQDGESPSMGSPKTIVAGFRGKSRPAIVNHYAASYSPIAADEEIDTMEEAWDALKSSKWTLIHLVFIEEEVKLTFYPEKELKRDNASIFVDYLTAMDESQ